MKQKIFDQIDRIATVAADTSKHIVIALYINWFIMVSAAFIGPKAALIFGIVALVMFVVWEIYFKVTQKKPFSVKDVLSGAIVILPTIAYLVKIVELTKALS